MPTVFAIIIIIFFVAYFHALKCKAWKRMIISLISLFGFGGIVIGAIKHNTVIIICCCVIVLVTIILFVKNLITEMKVKREREINRQQEEEEEKRRKVDYQRHKEKLINEIGKELNDRYEKRDIAFRQMALAMATTPTGSAKKHDSAIMGGIADGLFGAAAGIYTAAKTEQYNASVDEYNRGLRQQRLEHQMQAVTGASQVEVCEREVIACIRKYAQRKVPELEKELYNIDIIFRKNNYALVEYLCDELLNKSSEKAIQTFVTAIKYEISYMEDIFKIKENI